MNLQFYLGKHLL